MKYKKCLLALVAMFISSCEVTNTQNSSNESEVISTQESVLESDENIGSDTNISEESESSEILNSSEEESSESSVVISEESEEVEDPYIETKLLNVKDILLNEGEVIEITNIIDLDEYTVVVEDESIAVVEDIYIGGLNEGNTTLTIYKDKKKQTVNITVVPQKEYVDPYKFSEVDLSGKKMVAFGDSVTAVATLGASYANYTYSARFANHYGMTLKNNYAIGGTTATYTYYGSNIYKEYSTNKSVLDGCQVVYKAYKAGELADVDYAFIAYGHNDQYFQPPISVLNDKEYSVSNQYTYCKSYKGSYRFMINLLRLANPDINIVLLNCTYSEYDKAHGNPYGKIYSYERYRQATKEIAIEMGCKHIDPWNYMKEYYDFGKGNIYYKDSVHLTVKGHQVLADYIISQ